MTTPRTVGLHASDERMLILHLLIWVTFSLTRRQRASKTSQSQLISLGGSSVLIFSLKLVLSILSLIASAWYDDFNGSLFNPDSWSLTCYCCWQQPIISTIGAISFGIHSTWNCLTNRPLTYVNTLFSYHSTLMYITLAYVSPASQASRPSTADTTPQFWSLKHHEYYNENDYIIHASQGHFLPHPSHTAFYPSNALFVAHGWGGSLTDFAKFPIQLIPTSENGLETGSRSGEYYHSGSKVLDTETHEGGMGTQ